MRTEIKERWLTALRSGDYKQSNGTLKSFDGYCCLGVLCDIVKGDLNIDWESSNADIQTSTYTILQECSVLPSMVINYCKLSSHNPFFKSDEIVIDYLKGICDDHTDIDFIGNLAELNDAGADFNFIADVIEKNL